MVFVVLTYYILFLHVLLLSLKNLLFSLFVVLSYYILFLTCFSVISEKPVLSNGRQKVSESESKGMGGPGRTKWRNIIRTYCMRKQSFSIKISQNKQNTIRPKFNQTCEGMSVVEKAAAGTHSTGDFCLSIYGLL